MPLINTSVPNLIQGVSQQPDATRFAGQCEEQENALSSVADGLKKRPNTRHIARLLTSAINSNSFVHFIDRDDAEKYVIIHDGTTLKAWNIISGVEATINGATGGYSTASGYLYVTNPRKALKALTIGDNTFFVNTDITVQMESEKTAELEKEAIVFVIQGDYKKEYEVNFSSGEEVVLEFNMVQWEKSGNSYVNRGNLTYQTGSLLDRSGSWRYLIPNNVTATIINAGSGYEPDKSFSDNYLITFNNIEDAFPNQFYYAKSFDVKIETNANGEVTAAQVQALGGGGSVFNTAPSAQIYSKHGTTSNRSTVIDFEAPAPLGEVFGNIGKIVFESGGNSDGSNADTRQIAFGLGFDNRESSDGARTNETTVDIISESRLAQPDVRGSVIKYKRHDGSDFKITTTDGLGDGGLGVAYKTVSSLNDLPTRNFNNFKVKIVGDQDIGQDDFYVEFITNDGGSFGSGSYFEVTAFNSKYKLNKSTLPHRLTNDDVNSFVFQTTPYEDRGAGDDNTNPPPSFVNKQISNVFFFKNRLGFLSEDKVSLSEAGEFFNFFRTTTQTLLDSAPIDVSVSSSRVTNLKSAKGFQENLVLFSDNGQFVLRGGGLLTPKTVSITPITNFNFEDQVDPLPLGSYIYFPFTRGAFTGMREFTVNASTDNYDSTEITEHVPAYIPKNIIDMTGTTSEDMIALLSGDEKGSLYIYNYFWNNNQKVLSAWSKFTFTGEIRGIEFVESTLYAVIVNNGETNLVELPLESGLTDAAGFVTHLDMRVASTVASGNNQIILPYTPADTSVEVYTTDGLKLNSTNSGATVTLTQAVTADTPVFVGIPYTMKYTFSEQLFKAPSGQGKSLSPATKLMLRNGAINFSDTAFFKVRVTPKFRDTFENVFTPTVVGSSTLGSLDLDSGSYRFPIFTKAEDTTITIENSSALPSNFQSAEFESFVHSRSTRIA